MDHEEYLGHSLAEIAAEKAAIIRPGVTAIIAPQDKEALQIILSRCKAVGVQPRLVESADQGARVIEVSAGGQCVVTFATDRDTYENVALGLRGRHQIPNAATAIALAEGLRERDFAISRAAIIDGIASARHPGRLELWGGAPRILLDGAHNPAAARALRDYLDEFVREPLTMIFGAMRDKALNEMAATLFPKADALILTSLDNPRAANLEMLTAVAPETFDKSRTYQASSEVDALRLARELTPAKGLVCVTGSLYLVGAVQKLLSREDRIVAHQGLGH
jgi:dihydrofolate synthase/folylpolyglutamate synthase